MRSLIKNDSGVQYLDEATIQRERRRRRSFRLLLALCCIGLAGFFVYQLFSTNDPTSGPAVSWSDPKSIMTWFRWTFNGLTVQLRSAVHGTFPAGGILATILKLVLCFGLGALFLRMPTLLSIHVS